MEIPTPDDQLPDWVKFAIASILGAGGLSWFRVWLENRRLSRKDFRETLLDRIRELESVVAHSQTRMGTLRVEMAHLEVKNRQLEALLASLARSSDDSHSKFEGGHDE